ncbi:Aste57867_13735 [Aphanomyces stellatus]|uniref:Aste57867_13735 protein n=1 Tax=Aphanomyces stellatus TaxID=120398 RepID=A0A485KYU3_9STRA|nr:hypothetical protein As57867_013685 [Aphanomyces stellatus]VFT90568.1 Aste57867_13735 [Aphanomyces stellatus]
MADQVVDYGHAFATCLMEGEGEFSTKLNNYDAAERLDLCSDSEDRRYMALLATMDASDSLKHLSPVHMLSSM